MPTDPTDLTAPTDGPSAGPAGVAVPPVVINRAVELDQQDWLDRLPRLIAEIGEDWGLTIGRAYQNGTEAFVADADLANGDQAVLKLAIPRPGPQLRREIDVLDRAGGEGCAALYRHDLDRHALLIERLGPCLHELDVPVRDRHELLCAAAEALWRPAPGADLPSGADKAAWLIGFVRETWETLGQPVPRAVVDHAVGCAERRALAHRDDRSVLVHGDVHEWNLLRAGDGYKLIDPDGLVAEPEYDLGIIMREDPVDLLDQGARARAAWLAERCGLDEVAIWEWGIIERLSTAQLAIRLGLQPVGDEMLQAALAVYAEERPT